MNSRRYCGMRNAECGIKEVKIQNPKLAPASRKPGSAIRNSRGFSYVALLVAITIIGISLGAAGKYWRNVMLREKEEELLFRGNQYKQAIERYYSAVPGKPQYPRNIDDLLTDNRTPAGKRHLRQQYKDPMTGEDFEIVTAQTASASVLAVAPQSAAVPGIIGVHSKSEKEPLKKDNFPTVNEDLAGKSKYSEWLFIAFTGTAQRAIPGQPQVGGQPQGFGQPSGSSPTPFGGQPPVSGPTPFGSQPPVSGPTPFGGQPPGGGQMPFGFQPQEPDQPPMEGSGQQLRPRVRPHFGTRRQ